VPKLKDARLSVFKGREARLNRVIFTILGAKKLLTSYDMYLEIRRITLVAFTFDNTSTLELAKHLLRHRTGSTATLYQYIYGVHRFSKWLNTQPDQLIKNCQDQDGDPKPKALAQTSRLLDDFVANLQAENLAPGSVSNHVKGVKALFRCNGLKLDLPYSLPKRGIYSDRAPNPEELQKLLDIANLRERVIISMLALGGFRIARAPLIRDDYCSHPKVLSPGRLHHVVHNLYIKAGLVTKKPLGRRYDLRAHSIRKFSRTQLASLGMDRDYIEYMMGHTISTYHDIQMKGIEYLRGIYLTSGLSIRPKTRISKIDALKEIIRAWDLNPEEILTREALVQPHRTVIDQNQLEQGQLAQLTTALRQQMLKEIRENEPQKSMNCRLRSGSPGDILPVPLSARYSCMHEYPSFRWLSYHNHVIVPNLWHIGIFLLIYFRPQAELR
jgi:hypothetical protein